MYDNVPRDWVHSRDQVLVAEMGSQLYFPFHCSQVLLKTDHVHQLHQNPAPESGHASWCSVKYTKCQGCCQPDRILCRWYARDDNYTTPKAMPKTPCVNYSCNHISKFVFASHPKHAKKSVSIVYLFHSALRRSRHYRSSYTHLHHPDSCRHSCMDLKNIHPYLKIRGHIEVSSTLDHSTEVSTYPLCSLYLGYKPLLSIPSYCYIAAIRAVSRSSLPLPT